MGLFRQVFGIYSWIWPLLVIIYITFTDAEKCKTGQFFDSAIGRCRPCFEKCQPGDLRKLCPESCKGWNATTPSPKCHKGEYWLEALGRCYKCSITCSQVLEGGKDVCPLECVGWNKKKPSPIKPSPTKPSPTKGSNTKNSRPNMRTADDDDKSHTLSWPYGVGLVIVVVLMPVTVAGVRKWRKRNHQGSIRGQQQGEDIEMHPLNNPANNPGDIQAPRANGDNANIGGNEVLVEIEKEAPAHLPIETLDNGDCRQCTLVE